MKPSAIHVWRAAFAIAGSLMLPAMAAPLTIEGTEFVVQQGDRTLKSPQLIGAEIDLGNGNLLRIDGVRPDPDDPGILLHRFSTRDQRSDWQNPCSLDSQGRAEGFPLPGRWDAQGRFHLSKAFVALTCTSGAQGKCVRFGYKPWAVAKDGKPLLSAYESCVRMVRADYCGDGIASTSEGMKIDVYDVHGVQRPESAEKLPFEAGWSPDGAVCVNHTRVPRNLTLDRLMQRCPRLRSSIGNRCSEESAARLGAVVFNRSR